MEEKSSPEKKDLPENFKKKTWEEKITYYEEKLLHKVKIKNYSMKSIKLNDSKMAYIEIGKKENPKLLIIHGLLSSGIYFFKIFPYLKKFFHIIIIDCIGFGKSDRSINKKTTNKKEALDFFIQPILLFIEKLKLDNFILLGHSFGGFLSGHLIPFLEDKIKAVFMVSPCGFIFKEFSGNEKQKVIRRSAYNHELPEFLIEHFLYISKKHANLVYYVPGFVKQKLIKHSLNNDRINLDEDEKNIFFNIYNLYFEKEATYINNFFELIQITGNSFLPINGILEKYDYVDFFVYYPENDFLDYKSAKEEMKRLNKLKNFKILKNTNHQIFIHNRDDFLQYFMIDVFKFL